MCVCVCERVGVRVCLFVHRCVLTSACVSEHVRVWSLSSFFISAFLKKKKSEAFSFFSH